MNTSGSAVGRPSRGSRAWRWRIGRSRLDRLDRLVGDLVRRDRQVRRHRRRVDRAGDRAADDDLRSRCRHGGPPLARRQATTRRTRPRPACAEQGHQPPIPPAGARARGRRPARGHGARRRDGPSAREPRASGPGSGRWPGRRRRSAARHPRRRRGGQVEGLERAHERPAQAEPVAHRPVDVVGRGVALGPQRDRLAQHRGLEPVEDEPRDLLADDDRRLTDPPQQVDGPLGDVRVGRRRRGDLDDRDDLDRVGRVDDEAPSRGPPARS